MWTKGAALVALLLVAVMASPKTKAALSVIDTANLRENIIQAARTLQQIQESRAQLQTMYRNLEFITEPNWRDLRPFFGELDGQIQRGASIPYTSASIFELYRSKLPGYVVMHQGAYEDVYKAWSGQALDTMAAALSSAHAHAEKYEATQEQLMEIQSLMDNASGNLEAVQASGMLQSHTAQEVSKLNQMLAATMNSLNVYFGTELQLQAVHEATVRHLIEQSIEPWTPYTGQTGAYPIPANWPYDCYGCKP